MSSKLPPKQDGKPVAKSRLSPDEEIDLDAFCEDIVFDDISFDDWQDVVESLDLIIDLHITNHEAQTGVTKEVGFTRTVDAQRIMVRLPVDVPPGTVDGARVTLAGAGDRIENRQGDLHVIIRLPADS